MNEEYKRLKAEYDQVGREISALHDRQNELRDLMEEACTHSDLLKIEPDSYLVGIGVEDDEVKYKCKDCYRYFTKEEVEVMKAEQGESNAK
ncbi:hypothetical protein ACOMCU_00395 [Lysinibacillus sp. UGB7]|uniref:hypothetical protein n=1 Tax=Lysinibacillus sp. UGB7 TaxID=3411039 RepID=UPI003B7AED35